MLRVESISLLSIVCLAVIVGIGAPRSALAQVAKDRDDQVRRAISPEEQQGAHHAARSLFAAYRSYEPDPELESFKADLEALRSELAKLRHSFLAVTEGSVQPAGARPRQPTSTRLQVRRQEQKQRVQAALSRVRTQTADRRELLRNPPGPKRKRVGPKGEQSQFSGPRQAALSKVEELASEVEALLALPADQLKYGDILRLENRLRLRPKLEAPRAHGTPTLRTDTRYRRPEPSRGRPPKEEALR